MKAPRSYRILSALLAGLTATWSCGDSKSESSESESSSASEAASEATEGESESEGEAESEGETETSGEMVRGPVRFIALGDGGEGNEAQYMVADAVEMVCAARGCDFALYLGDNFYDDGVFSVDDSQFQDKFELPYADLDFRFYVVLGNHDYGEVLPAWERSDFQIEYTNFSDKWYLPYEWYTWQVEHVQFFALDTHRLMHYETEPEQRAWLKGELAKSTADWKISLAHHPYISNGSHGNAGNYEGLDSTNLAGANIQDFVEGLLCGAVDIYLSGHDHDRQWLEPTCGTQFIVSGAASKTRDFEHRNNNPFFFEDDQTEGFLWVEIVDDEMTGVFYDRDGNINFEKTITRGE